jgi:hypothetical protein
MALVDDKSERLRVLARRLRPANLARSGSEWDLGIPALTHLLPKDFSASGFFMEWLRDAPEAPAESLALQQVRARLHRHPGPWVVVDEGRAFSPACVARWGISLDRLLVIRPDSQADGWWAVEQAFRCPGVAETWCWADRAPEIVLRRWKLALEAGGGAGVVFRTAAAGRQPSWADVRWRVIPLGGEGQSQGRRVRVELLSCRGAFRTGAVDLEIDDDAGAVRVASPMAHSASLERRSVG